MENPVAFWFDQLPFRWNLIFCQRYISGSIQTLFYWCVWWKILRQFDDWDYNMVGMVVALVFSTMHVKSYIDSHNAQKFEKKKFSHSHISQSQWWNCGSITVMNFLSCHNYTTQLFKTLFLAKLSQDSYLNYHWFHYKIWTHNLQKRLFKLFPI